MAFGLFYLKTGVTFGEVLGLGCVLIMGKGSYLP
jgi:hypothetical protein